MTDQTPPVARPIGDTTVTPLQLMDLGAKLLNAAATVELLGHASPGSALDYWHADSFVRDFVAWTSGRKHMAEGCEERVRQYVKDNGWDKYVLQQAGPMGSAREAQAS